MSKETKTVSWAEWARLTNKSITDIRNQMEHLVQTGLVRDVGDGRWKGFVLSD